MNEQQRSPIRLLIVDDDPLVRSGLRTMLGGTAELEIVGEATNGAEVPAAVDKHRPDIVLMDIRMPEVDGLVAAQQLRRRADPPEVIMLTTMDTDENVLRALRAGASGFLLKHTPPAEIVDAILRVSAGEPILSPTVTRQLINHVADDAAPSRQRKALDLLGQLSEREREVAMAIGEGKTNAEIASELFMSVPTVKAHITRLLAKLDLNNRVQIALLAHDANSA
ncbi:DNA-binding NarL/FixJ family response regulator [Kutzneria viridogrisea]|nr:response regulator transcription factor [Kutzneria albida]MBA8928897.1 DNA-binding NarL/FixJ family response regulator [Kutzneria viridogrisea]